MHLVLDGSIQEARTAGELRDWLEDMPQHLGMTRITPAIVEEPEPGLLVGIVLLAESHVSVHIHAGEGWAHVDLFTCKWFDVDKAAWHVAHGLGLRLLHRLVLPRGLETLVADHG